MIRVVGDRVLVALPPREDEIVSAGGIVLVKDPDRFQAPTRGIVVALGEKKGMLESHDVMMAIRDDLYHEASDSLQGHWSDVESALGILAPARFDVEVGDCVIFPRSAGEEIRDGDVDFVILREAEILGVIEPKASAA